MPTRRPTDSLLFRVSSANCLSSECERRTNDTLFGFANLPFEAQATLIKLTPIHTSVLTSSQITFFKMLAISSRHDDFFFCRCCCTTYTLDTLLDRYPDHHHEVLSLRHSYSLCSSSFRFGICSRRKARRICSSATATYIYVHVEFECQRPETLRSCQGDPRSSRCVYL
jgi:hypothetical protein